MKKLPKIKAAWYSFEAELSSLPILLLSLTSKYYTLALGLQWAKTGSGSSQSFWPVQKNINYFICLNPKFKTGCCKERIYIFLKK